MSVQIVIWLHVSLIDVLLLLVYIHVLIVLRINLPTACEGNTAHKGTFSGITSEGLTAFFFHH